MTAASPVTNNEIPVRVRVEERAAVKALKGNLTYTQYCLGVREGILPLVKLPASAYQTKFKNWGVMKLYVTDAVFAVLSADAEKRGTTISRALRADIFQPPKTPVPVVKAKSLRLKNVVPDPTREALAVVRDQPEFGYTALMSEGAALVEIAGVLLEREAKAHI